MAAALLRSIVCQTVLHIKRYTRLHAHNTFCVTRLKLMNENAHASSHLWYLVICSWDSLWNNTTNETSTFIKDNPIVTGVLAHFLHSLSALCLSRSLSCVFTTLTYLVYFGLSAGVDKTCTVLNLQHEMCFPLDVLLNHWYVCFLLVWLLKCAKLAKPELVPAFMLGGAAKMSPPKSLRRSNLLSWNCCWWVCPRLTTGDWWRQEMDWKKELYVMFTVYMVHDQPSHKH